MNITNDRRAPGTTRIPFDAMVEVGGALGPSFEAQAVNVSGEGMSLKTAYLPEIGQPVTCRFEPARGASIVATGQVVWNEERGDGGEFGIRFTELDAEGAARLQRVLGMNKSRTGSSPSLGTDDRKVRLHIEGLASPMRARAKGAPSSSRVKAVSELGFLQLGRPLDVEDASTGKRRPASVDRVDVEIQGESRIPQLVVSLRYEDEEALAAGANEEARVPVMALASGQEPCDEASDEGDQDHEDDVACADGGDHEDDGTFGEADEGMGSEGEFEEEEDGFEDEVHAADPIRGGVRVRLDSNGDFGASEPHEEATPGLKERLLLAKDKVSPALEQWAARAKGTAALLARRALERKAKGEGAQVPSRRTTAPAPTGGLQSSGRKVVRVAPKETVEAKGAGSKKKGLPISKKHMVIGGAAGLAAFIGVLAFHSPDKPEPVAIEPTVNVTPAAVPVEVAPPAPLAPAAPAPLPAEAPAPRVATNAIPVDDSMSEAPAPVRKKVAAAPTPFGNGPVRSGNVLRLKMDGDIERIHGASQPTGFTVVLPSRKSLEAAAPLAARDPRIATMRVLNEEGGAELAVSFKDGVPNYQVRAKGDTLEIVLAREGQTGDRAPEARVTKKKTRATKKHR